MKLNSPRRPLVHDLVDCIPSAPTEKDVVDVPIQKIVPYHNHPFTLYTGDRLTDMVESIRTHGILTPCIVLELPNGRYEMLAGHNRMNAASIAGLTCIPGSTVMSSIFYSRRSRPPTILSRFGSDSGSGAAFLLH